jgi:hypothetical protein
VTRSLVLTAAAFAVAFALAGCGGSDGTAVSSEIVDVAGIEPVREQFDADDGKRRLLLVLSPT